MPVDTARNNVPLTCTYCDFMQRQCWPMAEMEMDGAKPVWVIPPAPSGPVLDAQNICQQFRLSESMDEWTDIWRGWVSDEQFHSEEERELVKQIADQTSKRFGQKLAGSTGSHA